MDKNIIFFNESQEMTEQYNLYSNWWQFPNLWKWSNDKMAAKKLSLSYFTCWEGLQSLPLYVFPGLPG